MVLSKEQIQQIFQTNSVGAKLYRKSTQVQARKAKVGTEITTYTKGVKETSRMASDNMVEVHNIDSEGEVYLVDATKFSQRYVDGDKVGDSLDTYTACGELFAFEWGGESCTFVAPWDEEMIINKGDYLGQVPGDPTNVYRVERDAMHMTYKPVE